MFDSGRRSPSRRSARSGLLALCATALVAAAMTVGGAAVAGAGVDPSVTVSPGGVVVSPEGDAGSTLWQLPVTLSGPAATEVTVDWTTLDVTATGLAKSGVDFAAGAGTLTFAPGDTSEDITIEVLGDNVDEPPFLFGEWGFVQLSNPSANAVLDPGGFFGLGVFVIIDDDAPPTITAGVGSVTEGNSGTTNVDVPVTLSHPSATEITVDWTTKDLLTNPAVAIGDTDYVADSGTVTFAPGDTAEVVSIDVIGDTVVEPPLAGSNGEWGLVFFDNASSNSGGVNPSFFMLGVFIIIDDDSVNQPPTIVPSSYSTIGNVQLRVDDNPGGTVATPSDPFIEATPDQPLADNSDVDSILTAQAGAIATANGGSADINTDGTFLYTPPVGFEGSDTFTYTVLEDGVDNGATETVTITVADVVWFVDNSSGPGTGGSQAPLPDLSTLDGGGGTDDPGDIIFVYEGSGSAYGGGIGLEADQQLLGEGDGLNLTDSNDGTQSLTVAAGARPTLTNVGGNGIDLASGNTVRGLDIDAPSGSGLGGTAIAGLTVADVDISNAGVSGVAATNLTGSVTFDNISVTDFDDIGIDIGNSAGALTLSVANSVFDDNDDVSGREAIAVESSGGATFDADITDNSFNAIESDAVTLRMLGTGGVHDVNILDNVSTNGGGPDDFPAGGGISLILQNSADVTFDIQGNTLTNAIQGIRVSGVGGAEGRIGGPLLADGNTVTLRADVGAGTGDSVELDMGGGSATPSTGNETWTILIQNNALGDDAASPTLGSDGIGVLHRDSNGTLNVTIEDNTIANIDDQAIDFFTDEDSALAIAPFTNARVVDNDFVNLADDAIEVDTDETAQICLHISGNDNGAGGSPGTFDLDQRNEPATVLEVTQVSIAAVSAANAGAIVVPTGTITFNGGCTNPPLPAN